MGIQLARFQQVLLHTSNGQRFFPGKAGLPGNPGCKVFEGAIEIEDLSRAVELFAYAKIRTEYKRNAEGERLNKAKDVLAEKPYFYPPSVIADRDAAQAAAASGNCPAAPVNHTQTIRMINTAENETPDATPDSHPMVPASLHIVEAEDGTHGMPTLSGIGQVRKHSSRSREPTEKPEVAFEDLRMLWKEQARIEEGKTKAKQKQKDIKKKVSNVKQVRRNDENKLRGWEEKMERLRQTLKGHEDDLGGLAEQYQEATKELKDLEREAKMLVSDFDLAVIKRKRDELEQDEERIKKQKQALVKGD
jgi:DNA repair exonuclease SbcCD ATPase subunit